MVQGLVSDMVFNLRLVISVTQGKIWWVYFIEIYGIKEHNCTKVVTMAAGDRYHRQLLINLSLLANSYTIDNYR
jgi:hypothetical protein